MSLTGQANITNITTTEKPSTNSSVFDPHQVQGFHRSISILFVPVSLIAIFCILSGIMYYMLKKRRLDQLRHHLVPMYSFDPGEGDDWETEVLEPTSDQHQQRRAHGYKSMENQNMTSPRL